MKKIGLYSIMSGLVFGLVILGVLLSSQVAMGQQEDVKERKGIIYYDYIDKQGILKGGTIKVDPKNPHHTVVEGSGLVVLRNEWNVETIIDNGPTTNRIDLVIVGDGYTELELGDYAAEVNDLLVGFFEESPLDEYASFYNVHRVDVNSNDSGVDHDPVYPTWRDTELDMRFWCSGIERLLCVNVYDALQAANQAPDRDQVIAMANSAKYGGGGYIDNDLATLAGGSALATEIALHEFGHSFGDLEDEYFDPNGVAYTEPESSLDGISNLSTLWATDMNDLNNIS